MGSIVTYSVTSIVEVVVCAGNTAGKRDNSLMGAAARCRSKKAARSTSQGIACRRADGENLAFDVAFDFTVIEI